MIYTSPGANVPGAIVKATSLYVKKSRLDERLDVLLDVGLLLDGQEKITITGEDYEIIVGSIHNPDDLAASAYYVILGTDSIYQEVFDATIIDGVIDYQKFRKGPWVTTLNMHAEMTRRDKYLKLVTGEAA